MRSATKLALAVITLTACVSEPAEHEDHQAPLAAPWLLSAEGSGTWTDPDKPDVVFAWVDLRVANVRYHKRVLVDVVAPYDDGVFMRTMSPATFERSLDNNLERWGTSAIELYPTGGPGGRQLSGPVAFRARIQHDADGDQRDEMVATPWQRLYGDGELVLPATDVWAGTSSPINSAAPAAEPTVLFSPFDDPGRNVISQINAIIRKQNAAPENRHTLHAAVFNINDPEIVDKLIEAHQAGVEVRLVIDGRKLRPWYSWHSGDDRLLAAGVPVLGVKYAGTGAMHTKIALFDGLRVATGSFNWEWGARHENHENMVMSEERDLITAYARRFEVLAGGVQRERVHAVDRLSFAPDEAPQRIVGELIDGARHQLLIAMFTAKDVRYWENGSETSLHQKLVAAVQRGVDVRMIVDHGIHEAAEFHGIETPDDPSDEWLEDRGVRIIRADNPSGRYASMHHKFVVADDDTVVTGAFNWYYDAAYANDEDQLILRDPSIAAKFKGEFIDLARRYDPNYDANEWPQVTVDIVANHPGTLWGDGVGVVGDATTLGVWNPNNAVALDASQWPRWTGSVTLPMGTRWEFKLIVIGRDGHVHWESGTNRRLTVPARHSELAVDWRR